MLYIILVVLPVQLTFPTRRSSDLQRGTGLSTPVNRHTLAQQGAPSAQARYLRHFRAPDIVADAEAIRRALNAPPWVTLGQSFGGFCTLAYQIGRAHV